MGTGGTISGVGRFLKEKNSSVHLIGVDPMGSLYYEFFKIGENRQGAHVRGGRHRRGYFSFDHEFQDSRRRVAGDRPGMLRLGAKACKTGRHLHGRLGRGLRCRGAARGARTAARQHGGGVSAGHGHALLEQDLQRRMDARARLRGRGGVADGGGCGSCEESARQGARTILVARPYQTVFHALRTMQEQDISQLPVFEESNRSGQFTRTRF